ncbi:MAG: uracil-DNA glycosylase [Candidatus Saccharibacteria bacterium]|nr:uracil-DNA glycosylase [Candidatus Saccharibacteria bacterium]
MKYNSWRDFIEAEAKQDYFKQLWHKVETARQRTQVFPERQDIFSCFYQCPLEKTKVVIIGQDPYHGEGQAHGMSFSVKPGVKLPPSLQNIFKELENDLGIKAAKTGYLAKWAEEGVLLLNTSFSVEKGKPASHAGFGWMEFTEHVLEFLNEMERPLVFVLWGAHAQKVGTKISNPIHCKIATAHPSPFSANRGFFGSKPFSKINDFLLKTGQQPIDWQL